MPATAGAIRAGRAFVELFGDNRSLVAALNDSQKRLAAFGQAAMQMGKQMLMAGGAAATPFVLAVRAASNLEETMNKFNVVFAGNANAMKAWGENFAQTIGRSNRQVLDFMASTQDLLVPIGFSPGHAEQFSRDITGLAIDLASFNNIADADALRDLHAALTGSGEVMKKYGVIVSEAAVQQELMNQGLDPSEATEQHKVMARLNIILEGTKAAQGDAIRSSEGFANQTKRLRGELENLLGTIGEQLLPVVTPYVEQLGELAKMLPDIVKQHEDLVPMLANATFAFIGLSVAIYGVGLASKAMALGLAGVRGAVFIFGLLGTAVGAVGAPVVALGGLLIAFVGTVLHCTGMLDDLKDAFLEFAGWIGRKLGIFDEANDKLDAMGRNAANAANRMDHLKDRNPQPAQMDAAGHWHNVGVMGGDAARPPGVGVLDDMLENQRIQRDAAAEARRRLLDQEKARFLREDLPFVITDERNPNFIGPASPGGGASRPSFAELRLMNRPQEEEISADTRRLMDRVLGPGAVETTNPLHTADRIRRLSDAREGLAAVETAGIGASRPQQGTFSTLASQMFASIGPNDLQKQIKDAVVKTAENTARIARKEMAFGV